MENISNSKTESPAPTVLFHASRNRGITLFEPRAEKYRDPLEGPVVFATPDKAYASCFLVPTDDSWVKIGRYSNDGIHGPWNAVISNEGRFKQADSGGVIYHLPIQSFAFHPERNMGNIEWTSTLPVKPVDKELYESGLSAMRKAGVNVYFVDWAIFDAIKQSNDHGKSIIDSLSPDYRTQ